MSLSIANSSASDVLIDFFLDADLSIERDIFLYRSYLALKKYGIVRDEIKAGSPELLLPLKTLASYLSASEGAKKVRYLSLHSLGGS